MKIRVSFSLGRKRLDRSFRIWQIFNRKDNDQLLPIVCVKERQKELRITCIKDYIGHILIKKLRGESLNRTPLESLLAGILKKSSR